MLKSRHITKVRTEKKGAFAKLGRRSMLRNSLQASFDIVEILAEKEEVREEV